MKLPGSQSIENQERNAKIIALYSRSRLTFGQIAMRLGLSKDTVKGVIARWRHNKSPEAMKRYLDRKMDFSNSHPLVRELVRLQVEQRIAWLDVARRAGVSPSAIRHWRSENGPRLTNFEAVLNVLGYELLIRTKEDIADDRRTA